MKQIILISTVILSLLSCKAQNITPIFGNSFPERNPNNYYKDVDNDLNKFEGTWTFQDGNTTFTIKLIKKLAVNDGDGSYIYDMLIGEYFYSEDNNTIVDTLIDLNNPTITSYNHNIAGERIINKLQPPVCLGCDISERRVNLIINDPLNNDSMGWLTLRYVNDNGIEKLEANIKDDSMMGSSPQARLKIPNGNYTLIKQ